MQIIFYYSLIFLGFLHFISYILLIKLCLPSLSSKPQLKINSILNYNVYDLIMEVNSKAFTLFLATYEIENRCFCPKTEKMRHIVETGLALLATTSLPLKFWLYAFHTVIFLINQMLSKVLQLQSRSFSNSIWKNTKLPSLLSLCSPIY